MQKTNLLIKSFSSNPPKTSQNWRFQIKQTQLVCQISSILLQRHNWPSLLQTLTLKSKLTPSLFLQILSTTQTHPQISLNFFNWAIKHTSLQPCLAVQCKMTRLLIGSGFIYPSKPLLDSLLQDNPPPRIVESLILPCEGGENEKDEKGAMAVLGCVVDWYCEKGFCLQALEVFNLTRMNPSHGNRLFSVRLCNTLMDALQENNEVKLALCFYAVMLRNGVSIDRFTWRIVAKMLSKKGMFDSLVRIIGMGIHDPAIYDLAIECCSEKGMFKLARHMFDEMTERKHNPGFNTCVSILNGACRYTNDEMIEFAMETMVEKGYISKPVTEYDSVIQKHCETRKTFAAHMLFTRACDERIPLENETYGCLLRAFSLETRVKDAIGVYRIIKQRRIHVESICFDEFSNVLCGENPSKEVSMLLTDMISRGHKPSPMELSKYVTSQCKKRRWDEAEELTHLALENSIVLEDSCYGALVKRYCKRKRIDLAVKMHEKMEKDDLGLDSNTYNALLCGILGESRVEEAERIFEYMRKKNLHRSESFVIMIDGFCRENELRKAMKLHDEMVAMGLKPGLQTYKRLISNFK